MNFPIILLYISKVTLLLFFRTEHTASLDFSACDQHVTKVQGQGTFSHLNHPFNYSQNLDCRISIYIPEFKAGTSLCFVFKKFRLNKSPGCSDDYLDVSGVGKYCGSGWKDGIENSGNSIFKTLCMDVVSYVTTISFRTQARSLPNLGFYANFYVSDQPTHQNEMPCKNDEQACANGDCVLKEKYCDGKVDCKDGSDETTHHAGCSEKEIFQESCSFENGDCGFTSNRNAWGRSNARYFIDHTTQSQSGFVMTTYGDKFGVSSLTTPILILNKNNNKVNNGKLNQPDDYCFSFWYQTHHIIEQFNVYLYLNVSLSSGSPFNFVSSFNLKKLLLSRDGYYGIKWSLAEIDIKEHMINSSKIQFDVQSQSESLKTKIFSIDDIALSPGKCYRGDISCTFEVGQCGWRRMLVPSFDAWKLHTSYFKANSYMHVQMNYMRMKSSELGPGRKAVMISRPMNVLPSKTACLFFKLFIKGPGSAFVRLNLTDQSGDDRTIWTMKSRNSFEWEKIKITINFKDWKIVLLKLEAFNTSSFSVVVGFDDVVMYPNPCGMITPDKGYATEPKDTNLVTPSYPHYVFPSNRPQYTFKPMHCPSSMFKCNNGLHCISMSSRCDGRSHCYDGSDELDCFTEGRPPMYKGPKSLKPGAISGIIVAAVASVSAVILIIVGISVKRHNQRHQPSGALTDTINSTSTALSTGILLKPPPYSPTPENPPSYPYSPPSYETTNPVIQDALVPENSNKARPPKYSPSTHI